MLFMLLCSYFIRRIECETCSTKQPVLGLHRERLYTGVNNATLHMHSSIAYLTRCDKIEVIKVVHILLGSFINGEK